MTSSMYSTRRTFLVMVCLLAAFNQAHGRESKTASDVTAIDILLSPDEVMMDRARAANDRLRADYPKGFALDATHAPHVTLIQRFVRTGDLDKVHAAIAKVLKEENPTSWELNATGYYDIPVENLGLAGIVIEPTADLLRLQQKLIDAVAPFNSDNATAEAFARRPDGKTIAQAEATIDYVTSFVPKASGKNFNPHVTIGLGTRQFLDKLKAKPFQSFTFKARAVDVYQLGEFGTAQKLLWSSAPADPLPSWNNGQVRQSIIDFVGKVTKEGGPDFVPVAERIATFDNDGTLWAEQPMYFQFFFVFDRIKALAPHRPEWTTQEPFASVLKGDLHGALAGGEKALLEMAMATHAGMTTEEFEKIVKDWIATAKHPGTRRPFTDMVYQPMLELLAYLRDNGFKTFIVSGGGIEFMRPWVEKAYGIPPEQVVGSSIKTQFDLRDGQPVLVRLPELNFIDDKEGKPVGINQHIGRRPIAAFGNSDGDLQMLQYTASGSGARFCLYVHHTDGEREWAYDRTSTVGHLDKGLDEAAAKGWTVVNMKDDWKQVFAFEQNSVTAIDILLEPDATMLKHAQGNNARLLRAFPNGFALDEAHRPHISLIQRFVRTADLDKVYSAAQEVLAGANVTGMKLEAFKYYYAPGKDVGVAGIVARPTSELLKLQQELIAAVAPFTVQTGTMAAFVSGHDDPALDAIMIEYVSTFVPKYSGENFNPHVSTGVAPQDYLDKMLAEPFEPFAFSLAGAAVYQLGSFGTAAKKLEALDVKP